MRSDCCTTDAATDIPTTEPSERKRYEQAVATAWSAGAALAMRLIRVVVTPMPLPKAALFNYQLILEEPFEEIAYMTRPTEIPHVLLIAKPVNSSTSSTPIVRAR